MPHGDDSGSGGNGERWDPGLPSVLNLPAMERAVLDRWTATDVPGRSLRRNATGPDWSCVQPPAAASGMPGIQHLPGRAMADLYVRYRAMRGFHVPRRADWDCHGLGVEVAVEKELGLTDQAEIEAYGLARFMTRCQESAIRHLDAAATVASRIGQWLDAAQSVRTSDPGYIESVWWSVRQLHDAGLLVRDDRPVPYCPRCQTPLSAADLRLPGVYRTGTGQAVTVRLAAPDLTRLPGTKTGSVDLLVEATAAWHLLGATAVAVRPDRGYAVARRSGHEGLVIVAEDAFARVLGAGWHIRSRILGADLLGARYRPAFDGPLAPEEHKVVARRVPDGPVGTGIRLVAPAFGIGDPAGDDLRGAPVIRPVRPDGRFADWVPVVSGAFFAAVERDLTDSLSDRDLVFSSRPLRQRVPHCWRCGTRLLRYRVPAWHLTPSGRAGELVAQAGKTRWLPPRGQIADVAGSRALLADWTVSRTRYWGTPLPLWECERAHVTCVGSLAELSELAGQDLTGLDPHRPALDAVTVSCPRCGDTARRVPDVLDPRYDTAAALFAAPGSTGATAAAELSRGKPVDVAVVTTGQTPGWPESAQVLSALLFGQPAIDTVIRMAGPVDDRGRPMNQRTGNVLEPARILDRYGADAVRWYCYAGAAPWSGRIISGPDIELAARQVLLPFWHATAFYLRYAGAARPDLATTGTAAIDPPAALDRWLLSRLNELIAGVTVALEDCDARAASRHLTTFVADLSRWYLRSSRARFRAVPGLAAATLGECLRTLARLLAPLAPFLADYVWAAIRLDTDPDSVHLAGWPEVSPELIDPELTTQMTLVRGVVSAGRAARMAARIRTRQPLRRAEVHAPGFDALPDELRGLIAAELNVLHVAELGDPDSPAGPLGWVTRRRGAATVALDPALTPELRRAGLARDLTRAVQRARGSEGLRPDARIAVFIRANHDEIADTLRDHGAEISMRVGAVQCHDDGVGSPSPDAREYTDRRTGLTFRIRPAG